MEHGQNATRGAVRDAAISADVGDGKTVRQVAEETGMARSTIQGSPADLFKIVR
jgi:transposase